MIRECDDEKLWHLVFHGSSLSAAMALVILDRKFNGRIMRELKRMRNEF